jgi:septum formation protein
VVAAAVRAADGLVLASRSPQRRALLAQIGVRFTVVEPAYEEEPAPGAAPAELARLHAVGKARSVEGPLVLGVDTLVAVGETVYGKPADRAEAAAVLGALGGRAHVVHSGLCLRSGAREVVRVAATEVVFRPLAPADLDWYLEAGEWRGRAGAYAVQGRAAAFVHRIHGDYTNVVGLPLTTLVEALEVVHRG